MNPPTLFGAKYSVYTRIARLALEEKQVPYLLEEVAIFADGGPPPGYLERQPFGKIPAFEHEGFRLYEAGAISRYIEDAFDGPPLLPAHPRDRARVNQLISLLDSYAYRSWVWDIFVERVRAPQQDRASDEALMSATSRMAPSIMTPPISLTRAASCMMPPHTAAFSCAPASATTISPGRACAMA